MKHALSATISALIGWGLYIGIVCADPEDRSRPCTGIIDATGTCQPSAPIPSPPATPQPQEQPAPLVSRPVSS